MHVPRSLSLSLLLCLPLLAGPIAAQPPPDKPQRSERTFNPRKVARPFPAITEATFLTAPEVSDEVNDNELVLGVVVEGHPRAYPINMLCGPTREIINDTLGGRVIAATW